MCMYVYEARRHLELAVPQLRLADDGERVCDAVLEAILCDCPAALACSDAAFGAALLSGPLHELLEARELLTQARQASEAAFQPMVKQRPATYGT